MRRLFSRILSWLLRDDAGLTTVEYAIMLVVIVTLAIAAWAAFSSTVSNMVGDGTNQFQNAGR